MGRLPDPVTGASCLFQNEFRRHVPGAEIPDPFPPGMAAAAGIAEILLPLLPVFGLGTRFAALGLLAMAVLIRLTIPEGWANFHLPWAAMALGLMVFGGGRFAVERLFTRG